MASVRTYLDYNATCPPGEAARIAMISILDRPANASSIHHEGRYARKIVENAREELGRAIGANAKQIIFTSGASEAATHALSPVLNAAGREMKVSQLYIAATEHPCVLAGGRFEKDRISIIPVLETGLLDIGALEQMLAGHDQSSGLAMVAVMLANNETGLIQPIAAISEIARRNNALLMVDAVQALGKIPLDVSTLDADFIILSSHKTGGPQGAGALVFGDATLVPKPLVGGGGQESFQRAGTENVAAIAGFAAAASEIATKLQKTHEIAALRDSIEAGVDTICNEAGNKAGEPVFFVRDEIRLPNTSCFAIPGVKSEIALISLDLAGFAVSSGSACSSGKVKKSHVLHAMGVSDDLAECALRISTGYETTQQDAERFLGAMKDIVNRIG